MFEAEAAPHSQVQLSVDVGGLRRLGGVPQLRFVGHFGVVSAPVAGWGGVGGVGADGRGGLGVGWYVCVCVCRWAGQGEGDVVNHEGEGGKKGAVQQCARGCCPAWRAVCAGMSAAPGRR